MTERPILFSGEMVRAILGGRKTQTRRVVKPQPDNEWMKWSISTWGASGVLPLKGDKEIWCPYGVPGDLLWVRETWAIVYQNGTVYQTDYGMEHESWIESWNRPLSELKTSNRPPNGWMIEYKADKEVDAKWRPSIHMPRWASRITLRVMDVRVERVQDITEADAQAEGVTPLPAPVSSPESQWRGLRYVPAFAALWNDINAARGFGWDANPWVWIVSFEVVK